ncbi:MAG: RNA polymerase subunit sigma-70, partial [Flavobacteriales bacterium]|nr:RNA polymerase subunit sigma-70 [Flavobacteriales bacterium]
MFKRKKKDLTDEEIVKSIVDHKNHDDFGLLYDRYSEKVYHKCISFVKDLDLAQDLAHDVFLKTFLNLSRFNHQSK